MEKSEILATLGITEEEYILIYAPQAMVKLTIDHLREHNRINALKRFNQEVQKLCIKFKNEAGEG